MKIKNWTDIVKIYPGEFIAEEKFLLEQELKSVLKEWSTVRKWLLVNEIDVSEMDEEKEYI